VSSSSKTFSRWEIKSEDAGEVTAVFATFNTIDLDGDVTVPGAFEDGAGVVISAYGHTSWGGALPVGKGVIRSTETEAILDGRFFLDTTAGRDTFTVVKELAPQGEWSYGYDPLKFSFGEFEGQRVRFLEQQKVYEVSPVMLGAGVNTRTLVAKSRLPLGEHGEGVLADVTNLIDRVVRGSKGKPPREASAKLLQRVAEELDRLREVLEKAATSRSGQDDEQGDTERQIVAAAAVRQQFLRFLGQQLDG
jgi:hypothetical protein